MPERKCDIMKIKYDQEVDVLLIELSDAQVCDSDESKPGVILDFDEQGNVIRVEILDASKRTAAPYKVEYEVATG